MALYLIINFHIVRSFHIQLMFVLFHFEPVNGQFRLYPSLPGVEGAQGISAGGPKGRLAAPRKKQSVWSRINLDNSQDLLNIIPTFSRAHPPGWGRATRTRGLSSRGISSTSSLILFMQSCRSLIILIARGRT